MQPQQNGDLEERKIVKRFKNSSKYNQVLTCTIGLLGLAGCIFIAPKALIDGFNISFAALGVFLIQVSFTLLIANLLIYHLIESPRRFLIGDAERELNNFMSNGSMVAEVHLALHSLSHAALSSQDANFWLEKSGKNHQDFLDLKSRHQIARAGSKMLGLRFWRAEIVILNEHQFFIDLSRAARDNLDHKQLRSRLRRALSSLEPVYCGELGDLPSYPQPEMAAEITEEINRFLRP